MTPRPGEPPAAEGPSATPRSAAERAGEPQAHEPRAGDVAPAVAAELPGLRLLWLDVAAGAGRSAPELRARLRALADRRRGADAVALRTRPIPRAYRACFRQLGLDPDRERIPAERLAVQRLMQGGLASQGRIVDACVIALADTSVGVWPLDAAAVDPAGPGIRIAAPGEPGEGGLVVADARTVHALLFADPLPGSAVGPRTRRVLLYALGVAGVPEIHLHEALWIAHDALA